MKLIYILDDFFNKFKNIFENIFEKIAKILKTDKYTLIISIFTLLSVIATVNYIIEFVNILIGGIGDNLGQLYISPIYPLIAYYYMIRSNYFKNSEFKKDILKFHIFMFAIIVSVLLVKIVNTFFWSIFFVIPNFLDILKNYSFNIYFSILSLSLFVFSFSLYRIYYSFFKISKQTKLKKIEKILKKHKDDNNLLNLNTVNDKRRNEFTNFLKIGNISIPEQESAKHTLIFTENTKNIERIFGNAISNDLEKRKNINDCANICINELLKTNKVELSKFSFATDINDIQEQELHNISLNNLIISSNKIRGFLKQITYNSKQMNVGITYIFDKDINIDKIIENSNNTEQKYTLYNHDNIYINPFVEENNKAMAKNISDTVFLLNKKLNLNLNINFESLRLLQNSSVILKSVYMSENNILPNLSDLKNILSNLNDISNLVNKFKKINENILTNYTNLLKYFDEILKDENIKIIQDKITAIIKIISEIETSIFAKTILSRENNISFKNILENATINYIPVLDNTLKEIILIQLSNYINTIDNTNYNKILPHNIYISNYNSDNISKSLLAKLTSLNICMIISEKQIYLDNIKYFNNIFAFVDVYSKYPEDFSKIFDNNILKYSKANIDFPRYLIYANNNGNNTNMKKQGLIKNI